jgi:phosphate transport system protein
MPARTELDRRLEELHTAIVQLGERIVEALDRAMTALDRHDSTLATEVVVGDDAIDQACSMIERMSLRVVVLHQPLVGDLRKALAGLMIAEELERMGDHAQGIAQLVTRLPSAPDRPTLHALGDLGRLVHGQVEGALAAYDAGDAARARAVWAGDTAVDERYAGLVQTLMGDMAATQGTTTRDTYLLWVAHNLERIADRATNICEHVVFIVTDDRIMSVGAPTS